MSTGLFVEGKLASSDKLTLRVNREPETVVEDGARQDNLLKFRLIAVEGYTGGMLFLNLMQAGSAGQIRAVEKFDYAKGYSFFTYVTWSIVRRSPVVEGGACGDGRGQR
ncbi:hypothetical protein [Streptomyces flavidovirens]|uniref:RNA polymerase sigma-70 region 2 domain-containing protein n=1 Tax=Streptomyces flavidovirens TaxID=67298 RepID=A0ABW6RPV4_9ACTN